MKLIEVVFQYPAGMDIEGQHDHSGKGVKLTKRFYSESSEQNVWGDSCRRLGFGGIRTELKGSEFCETTYSTKGGVFIASQSTNGKILSKKVYNVVVKDDGTLGKGDQEV